MATKRVSDVEFVRAVMGTPTLAAACAKIGMKPSGARARAKRLRAAGVKLPAFRSAAPNPVEVDALNALIARAQSTEE
jgi:hypothetical protein